MATIAELEALITANERRLARVDSDQARAVERINRQYANDPTTMQTELAAANAKFDALRTEILGALTDQRAELTALQNQPNPTPPVPTSAQPPPPTTASQAAQDDAPKGPNAPAPAQVDAGGRVVPPPDTTTPTNAEVPATSDTGGTTGTDAPTRTTEQTQATGPYTQGINVRAEDGTLSNLRKNPETGELYNPGGIPGGVDLKTDPGTPTRDDAANNSRTTTTTDVNAAQANPIQVNPQPNILDRYNNYAWSASVYLMSSAQYSKLMNSKDKKIDGYNLLFQSGGAGVSDGVIRPPASTGGGGGGGEESVFDPTATNRTTSANHASANRSPFFTNDFYIDSVTVENQCVGKGTGAAHLATSLKFTVVEPQGITLLERMYEAVANFEPRGADGKVNYTAATYLMVLRFYGYDESGNIVYPIKGGLDSPTNTSDPAAVVEKFIPFIISKVNWTIGTKTVAYDFEGAPVGQNIGGGSSRGTIPYDVQLVDSTVGGLLGGTAKYSTGTAPTATPGKSTTYTESFDTGSGSGWDNQAQTDQDRLRAAQAAPGSGSSYKPPSTAAAAPSPKKTITEGLMGAMNDFQQELVRRGTYLKADEYAIEFVGIPGLASAADISDAKIQLPNTKKDHSKAPMQQPTTTSPSGLNQQTVAVDYENRNFSITAGQQILQVIELVIRNSSYIGKQKLVIVDPDGVQTLNQQTTKNVTWFTISMSCERKDFDSNRNDYAYKIKYTVSPFLVKNLNSQYFPTTKFSGVHKSYPFWFTGQNTAVKDYQETLNTMFVSTLSGNGPGTSITSQLNKKYTSSMADLVKYSYSPRSDASNFGADGKELEPNANAAEILYNPSDLANTKVRIIGDPAWIMQGSQFKPVTASTVYPAARTGFEADGSISFDSQDILFEMLWQRPEDYDLSTGLADPYVKQSGSDKKPLQSRVYIATKVTSEFKGGSFEQTLDGSLYLFPIPSGKNAANPAAAASTSALVANPDAKRTSTGKKNNTGTGRLTQVQLAAAQKATGSGSSLRTGTFDTGSGGNSWDNQASVAGTQGNLPSFDSNGAPSYDNGSQQTNNNGTGQVLPAGAPKPPTDGAGGTVGVTEAVNSGPPKLPGLIARSNAAAAARGNQGRGSQSPGYPTSTTNPAVQQISKTDS
jgi:hypothetical protein